MTRQYKPYIAQTVGDLMDEFASMMFSSPKFEDDSGYFPGMSIDTEFLALNEGLKNLRRRLGDDRYQRLVALSGRMRAHFEADPDDKTGESIRGREIILEMRDILQEVPPSKSD